MMQSVFFIQARDGIRDLTVTGVQTCALPIYSGQRITAPASGHLSAKWRYEDRPRHLQRIIYRGMEIQPLAREREARGACRGRGEISGVAGLFKKKKKDN